MIAERDHKDYLLGIQGAIQDILDFTHGFDNEAFTRDKKTSYAVVRSGLWRSSAKLRRKSLQRQGIRIQRSPGKRWPESVIS